LETDYVITKIMVIKSGILTHYQSFYDSALKVSYAT